jgi:hypothetical protein
MPLNLGRLRSPVVAHSGLDIAMAGHLGHRSDVGVSLQQVRDEKEGFRTAPKAP